jgi:hypothetical protein
MSRYVVILVLPLFVGSLIAVTVLLINGLRERRERRHMELRNLDRAALSATPAADDKGRRIAS